MPPRRYGNRAALAVLLPTVIDYIQVVGLIMLDCVCRAFEPFSAVSGAFLTNFDPVLARFPYFETQKTSINHPTCGPTALERRVARTCVGPDRRWGRAGA